MPSAYITVQEDAAQRIGEEKYQKERQRKLYIEEVDKTNELLNQVQN